MITLTQDEAVRLMDEVVDEYGADHIYERPGTDGCRYVVDDKPHCLIAKILFRAGMRLSDLSQYEEMKVCSMAGWAREIVTSRLVPETGSLLPNVFAADEQVVYALTLAQEGQDGGQTWGVCRDRFRRVLDLVTS